MMRRQQAVYVKPAVPSKCEIIELSPFDNLAPPTSFHYQFVFKNEKRHPDFMHAQSLMKSLSQLLIDFPHIAGSISVNSDRKWLIKTEDIGVPFTVAHTELKLEELDVTDFDQLPKNYCSQWMKPGDPMWQIQVNYFQCGAVVLVSEMLHQLGDGETHAMLLRKWAKLHSNQPYDLPVLDRSLISASGLPPPKEFPHWHQSSVGPDYSKLMEKLPLCTAKLIEFSSEELEAMKRAATQNQEQWVSTHDSICSHLWRLITRARGLSGDQLTCLFHACNVRKKIDPPLPSDYVGYVIMNAQTNRIPVSELLSSPLSRPATLSRTTINEVTPEYVQSFIDYIHCTPQLLPSDMNVVFGTDVYPTSWVSFQLYSVVFENDERPWFAGEVPTILDGVFKLVEGRTPGTINVQISLLREHMTKLLSDPELHMYKSL